MARNPANYLRLTDGVTTVGVYLADGRGDNSPFAITRTPFPRLSTKQTSGESGYSSFRPPYTPVAQDTWAQGRGQSDHDKDGAAYLDGYRADTTKEHQVILGPQEVYAWGVRNWQGTVLDQDEWLYEWVPLTGSSLWYASRFAPAASFNSAGVELWLRPVGGPSTCPVYIYSDSSGPGTALWTGGVNISTHGYNGEEAKFVRVTISPVVALTGSTNYWVVVKGPADTSATVYWEVLVRKNTGAGASKTSENGTVWAADNNREMIYRVIDSEAPFIPRFFEYKGALYAALSYDGSSTPKLFINGDQGIATAGASASLTDGAKSWAVDQWAGCIVEIRDGAGETAVTAWRTISSNTSTALTVSPAWDQTPASGSLYVIKGSDRWSEITGHGLTERVRDVISNWGAAYFAMGEETHIRRMRRYANGTTWTTEWVDEVLAHYGVSFIRDVSSGGKNYVWIANGGTPSMVKFADAIWAGSDASFVHDTQQGTLSYQSNTFTDTGQDFSDYGPDANGLAEYVLIVTNSDGTVAWGYMGDVGSGNTVIKVYRDKNLTTQAFGENSFTSGKTASTYQVCKIAEMLEFSAPNYIGGAHQKINGLEAYGEPEKLWVFKEGSVYQVDARQWEGVPLREMAAVASQQNGRARLVHGVYLYFSLLDSLERFYRNNLDDIGPNRDEGLPTDRRGVVRALVGYPGRFFAAIGYPGNPGDSQEYSSILCWNQFGWHEIYRTNAAADVIRAMYIQVVPGRSPDRLWFGAGSDIRWIPVSLDPYNDPEYMFTPEASVESAWIYSNLQDVPKIYRSIKIFADQVDAGLYEPRIVADYRVDSEIEMTGSLSGQRTQSTTPFERVPGVYDTQPVEELVFKSSGFPTGRRLQYRMRLQTGNNRRTPRVRAVVVETMPRVQIKQGWSIRARVRDEDRDLQGGLDGLTAAQRLAQLDTWASTATPLTVVTEYDVFGSASVVIEPASVQPIAFVDDGIEVHIVQFTLMEI